MNSRPKILQIITQGEWGGAQRYVYDLTTHLSDTYDCIVAVGEPTHESTLIDRIESFNRTATHPIKTIRLEHLVRDISPQNDLRSILELNRLYHHEKPDLVHLHSSKASIVGSLARLFPQPTSTPIIYTAHGWVFNEPLSPTKRALYRFLEKYTGYLKSHIITLSDKEYLQATKDLHLNPRKVSTIPLGIEPVTLLSKETARALFEKLTHVTLTPNQTAIVAIANFYPTKGLDILLKACSDLLRTHKDLRLIIIGDGPERAALTELAMTLNIADQVHMVGRVPEAAKLLPAFDLFVLPSRKEGMPYTLVEALQARLPIVATSVGATPEMLQGVSHATLVPSEDVTALARTLAITLSHLPELQKNAQRDAEHCTFSLVNFVERINALYQSLLAPPRRKE